MNRYSLHEFKKPDYPARNVGDWFRSKKNNRITLQLIRYDADNDTWRIQDRSGFGWLTTQQIEEFYEPVP